MTGRAIRKPKGFRIGPKVRARAKVNAGKAAGASEVPADLRVVGDRIMVKLVGGKLRMLADRTRVMDARFEMGVDKIVAGRMREEVFGAFQSLRQNHARSTQFSDLAMEDQNVELFLIPDAAKNEADLTLKAVPVTKLKLTRDTDKDPDVTLSFVVTVGCGDGQSAWIARNYKNSLWIRFEAANGNLFEKAS
jgi:hypothetical protein